MKVSEIKVSYTTKRKKKPKITNSNDAYEIAMAHWDQQIIEFQEEVKLILVNRNNEVLGIYSLSKGGILGAFIDLKIILAVALKGNASGIILVHNHPSGNLKYSKADKGITDKLKKACKLLDINLLDHLIISRDSHFSFSNNGLLT